MKIGLTKKVLFRYICTILRTFLRYLKIFFFRQILKFSYITIFLWPYFTGTIISLWVFILKLSRIFNFIIFVIFLWNVLQTAVIVPLLAFIIIFWLIVIFSVTVIILVWVFVVATFMCAFFITWTHYELVFRFLI